MLESQKVIWIGLQEEDLITADTKAFIFVGGNGSKFQLKLVCVFVCACVHTYK